MKALITALFLIVLLGCSNEEGAWPKKAFVAEQWRMSSESERYVFARDLVESQVLLGKSASDVKQLLGVPSFESSANHYFTYVIKTGGEGFNQVHVLDVRLNPATGRVEKAIIRGD